jgi:hypothetical protein
MVGGALIPVLLLRLTAIGYQLSAAHGSRSGEKLTVELIADS